MENDTKNNRKDQVQVLCEGGNNSGNDVNYSDNRMTGQSHKDVLDTRQLTQITTSFGILFAINIMVVGFQHGYIFTYTNQTTDTLNAKFGWDKHDSTLYSSLIGSFGVGAMTIGTPISGKIMKIGRLKVLDIAAVIGMIGSGLTLYLNIYCLLAGRILYGFSLGLLVISWPRYMDEVLPPTQISFYGGIYAFSIAFGTITAFLLALGLPDDTDEPALKADQFWRVIWGLPIPMFLIQLTLMHTIVKYEPPKYLLVKIRDADDQCRSPLGMSQRGQTRVEKWSSEVDAFVRLIYKNSQTDEQVRAIKEYILSTCQKETSTCTIKQAFTTKEYFAGTWVALLTMFWHEIVGNNAIMLYSNTMLKDMQKNGNAILTPRQGTYLIGVVNFVASGTSIMTTKTFQRRTIFNWGYLAIAIAHFMIGLCAYQGWSTGVLISMLCFCMVYQNSSGAITWLYCSEVAVDVVLGFVGFAGYSVVFILSLTTQFLMQSETLHSWGTFWMFGTFSVMATVWFILYVKETKHLNDKEKKSLYAPLDSLRRSS